MDEFKAFFKKFWFLRGFFAGLALLGVVPNYLDLTMWEFARAVHAVAVGWNLIAARIAEPISELLPFIEIDALAVNIAILFFSTAMPAIVVYFREWRRTNVSEEDRSRDRFYEFLLFPFMMILLPLSIHELLTKDRDFLAICEPSLFCTGAHYFGLGMFFVAWGLLFLVSLRWLDGYGKGVVFLLTCLAAIEVAYFLPFVGDYVVAFADQVLGQDRITSDENNPTVYWETSTFALLA